MKKAPVARMRERFSGKAGSDASVKDLKSALVAAVRELATDELWLEKTNEDKGLEHVSNAKLLRLHDILSSVKKDFGGRAGLIDAILKIERREKDEGFRARLTAQSTPRLIDHYRAAKKRS